MITYVESLKQSGIFKVLSLTLADNLTPSFFRRPEKSLSSSQSSDVDRDSHGSALVETFKQVLQIRKFLPDPDPEYLFRIRIRPPTLQRAHILNKIIKERFINIRITERKTKTKFLILKFGFQI